jgi:hypothetical protein
MTDETAQAIAPYILGNTIAPEFPATTLRKQIDGQGANGGVDAGTCVGFIPTNCQSGANDR